MINRCSPTITRRPPVGGPSGLAFQQLARGRLVDSLEWRTSIASRPAFIRVPTSVDGGHRPKIGASRRYRDSPVDRHPRIGATPSRLGARIAGAGWQPRLLLIHCASLSGADQCSAAATTCRIVPVTETARFIARATVKPRRIDDSVVAYALLLLHTVCCIRSNRSIVVEEAGFERDEHLENGPF
jgi:hypothetical protein